MNIAMVGRLIWKDWYLNRAGILASLIGGVATLALIAAMHDSQVALIMGMIVLVTILIGMGAVVMLSAASERRQMTLPFVMSLPISYWEYTISKIAGGLLIFFALWVPLVAAIVATILLTPGIPHGLIPFVLIMAVEILMTTCLITADRPGTPGTCAFRLIAFDGDEAEAPGAELRATGATRFIACAATGCAFGGGGKKAVIGSGSSTRSVSASPDRVISLSLR